MAEKVMEKGTEEATEKALGNVFATAIQSAWPETTLAPPYTSPWRFGRNYPSSQFWTFVKRNLSNGELVLQMGANPHPPAYRPVVATLEAGFWRPKQLNGGEEIKLSFTGNLITARPRGGYVRLLGGLLLRRLETPQHPGFEIYKEKDLVTGQNIHITAVAPEPGIYQIIVKCKIFEFYVGTAVPYGEIISTLTTKEEVQLSLAEPQARVGEEQEADPRLADQLAGLRRMYQQDSGEQGSAAAEDDFRSDEPVDDRQAFAEGMQPAD